MSRILSIFALCFSLIAAACTTATEVDSSNSGVYRIRNADKVQFRMLDSVNALREAAGQPPVQLNAQLNAAAATHSRDMSVQNRPWHFGSDGSSPLDRVARTGFAGVLVGEAISETYESEVQTLTAWMEDPTTRSVVLDSTAANMGFFWFQEPNGKLWWTLVMGT
ncbi:CAP domain-containing protein [Epibacterium ulvae]|uniref:CAP domain-containing protein n=1 Tax=Epibacterium ulvae TaxID=1156985 RepID=UPI001BFC8068|nr:CAP domain-containing protein [Epibacterium ulvae]MBT8153569.1 CAP domain-containing protein [Epibacterium ulvae]